MYIHYLLTDLNSGGAALPLPPLLALMREQGHRVRVLALLPRDRLATERLARAGISVTLLGEKSSDQIGTARRLLRVIDEDRPDLLWTSLTRATIYGGLAGHLRGIPVVSWQHNAWLKPKNRLLLKLTRRLTALWVADSQAVAEFTHTALGVDRSQIEVWPLIRAHADAPCAAAWDGISPFRIGSLGRLHEDKRFADLIAAAALIDQQRPDLAARMQFVIGGVGAEHVRLAAQIERAKLGNVQLAGFVDAPEPFLATLHAYVQPSHHEGLCIAAHEAMQAGLPVIATRVGEMQRSVQESITGHLVPVGDVAALAAALIKLADNPAQAASMGQKGRERVLALFGESVFHSAGSKLLARAEASLSKPT